MKHYPIAPTMATAIAASVLFLLSIEARADRVADSWEAEQLRLHGIQACAPAGVALPEPIDAYGEGTMRHGSGACDDGNFCNGTERCTGRQAFEVGDQRHVVYVCRQSEPPCSGDRICNRDQARCVRDLSGCDQDGDGRMRPGCGGDDCDDQDPDRFPGNAEVCDVRGKDEDCNTNTPGQRDQDGDGFVDAACINYVD